MPTNIKFQQGVSRLRHAEPNRPYDLSGSRLTPRGVVSAARRGTTNADAPTGPKPWRYYQGTWYPLSRSTDDFEEHEGTLYGTRRDPPDLVSYDEESHLVHPPYIEEIELKKRSATGGPSEDSNVSYVFIPYNDRDEAGPWIYLPRRGVGQELEFRLSVSDECERVDCYRTLEKDDFNTNTSSEYGYFLLGRYNNEASLEYTEYSVSHNTSSEVSYVIIQNDNGFTTSELNWNGSSRNSMRLIFETILSDTATYPKTKTYTYYVLNSEEEGTNSLRVYLCDETGTAPPSDEQWLHQNIDSESTSDGQAELRILSPREDDLVRIIDDKAWTSVSGSENLPESGATRLQRSRNAMAQWKTFTDRHYLYNVPAGEQGLRRCGAKQAFNNAGVMMYGNVKIPTKPPAITSIAASRRSIVCRYEYNTPTGKKYGPAIRIGDAGLVGVEARDLEVALCVYVWWDSEWQFYERIEPSPTGVYISELVDDARVAFDSTRFDYARLQKEKALGKQGAKTTHLHEPKTVLLSQQNRPFEVSYDNFRLEEMGAVRGLAPARLAEEEGLRAYDFYAFGEHGIAVCKRDRRVVSTSVMSTEMGIALNNEGRPLYTPTAEALAFIGTNMQAYLASGRQFIGYELSRRVVGGEVTSDLWSDARDLAYHRDLNEVWLLTDTGIWGYSFDQQAWVMHRPQTDGDQTAQQIGYSFPDRLMLVRYYDSGADTYEVRSLNEEGTPFAAGVTTQPITEGGQELHVRQLELDYDADGYDAGDQATWATIQQAIRHPDILQVDEAPGDYPNKHHQTMKALANRSLHPPLRGRGQQFKISGFTELRDLTLELEPS